MAGGAVAFYVRRGLVSAASMMAFVQIGAAAVLAAAVDELRFGYVLPVLVAAGGALTAYMARWTSRTPLAVVDDETLELRPALFAATQRVRLRDIRSYETIPPGWLVLVPREGGELRIALTSLADEDVERLLATIRERVAA